MNRYILKKLVRDVIMTPLLLYKTSENFPLKCALIKEIYIESMFCELKYMKWSDLLKQVLWKISFGRVYTRNAEMKLFFVSRYFGMGSIFFVLSSQMTYCFHQGEGK